MPSRDIDTRIPPATDRQAWKQRSQDLFFAPFLHGLHEAADTHLATYPGPLRLGEYLDFFRTGERFAYEERYYARRHELAVLVMAECLDPSSTRLPVIADRIWQICEETSWCIPASACQQHDQTEDTPPHEHAIPGCEDLPFPDLFACETAAILAQTLHLLGPQIATISHAVEKRVRQECMRQVIRPFLSGNDYQWLAAKNNWGPWCASSVIIAVACGGFDDALRRNTTDKARTVLLRYLDGLPGDGFCEEGPSYAWVSLRSLVYAAEILEDEGDRALLYTHPRCGAAARAFAACHLGGGTVANFADAAPFHYFQPGALQVLGTRLDEPELQQLAGLGACAWRPGGPFSPALHRHNAGDLLHLVRNFFWTQPRTAVTPHPRPLARLFPDNQVAILTEFPDYGKGWQCALKGGHNNASHNHNDIGHCIILRNGRTLIADVGPETYHKHSWGPRRYETWCLRGSAHNLPVVNGVEQEAGAHHHARGAVLDSGPGISFFRIDATAAYPRSAGVATFIRSAVLDRTARPVLLRITDLTMLTPDPSTLTWVFLSPVEPTSTREGSVVWHECPGVCLRPRLPGVEIKILARELKDPVHLQNWGPRLWEIQFHALTHAGTVSAHFDFTAEDG